MAAPHPLRRGLRVALLALLGGVGAPVLAADDPPPAAPPPPPAAPAPARPAPPPTPEQAADAVLAARTAKDDAALQALAAQDEPDPWLVADELLRRGEHDAAAAFAQAAPRVDTEGLPAYVAAQRGTPDDAERRTRFGAAAEAWARQRWEEALEHVATLEKAPRRDVLSVRVAVTKGLALRGLGRLEEARVAYRAAADAAAELGWHARVSMALGEEAGAAWDMGAFADALELGQRLQTQGARRGNLGYEADGLRVQGEAYRELGSYQQALACYEALRSLPFADGTRSDRCRATALHGTAGVRAALGDYAAALAALERAHELFRRLGDVSQDLTALVNMAGLQRQLGRWAPAVTALERVLGARRARGETLRAAETLVYLSSARREIGDLVGAGRDLEQALPLLEALGARPLAAEALGTLGALRHAQGALDDALSLFERAQAAHEAYGSRRRAVQFAASAAYALRDLGRSVEARALARRVSAEGAAQGDPWCEVIALQCLAGIDKAEGRHAEALRAYEQALAMYEERAAAPQIAQVLGSSADALIQLGRPREALVRLRRAAELHREVVHGLGAEEGALAREPLAFVYDRGMLAALNLRDVAELAYFQEAGQAMALLEGLMARQSLWATVVPEHLRIEEARERGAVARASDRVRQAADAGDRAAGRLHRAELEAAQERLAQVVSRIQREARAGAAIAYPEPATLDALGATLAPEEALILHASFAGGVSALIVTPTGVVLTGLGRSDALQTALEGLRLDKPDGDPAEPLAALRRILVEPLKLPSDVRRVLISPAGALAYVPFAALLPDKTVVYVPSGTTYRLLREDEALRGQGVLALGDPDYATKVDERAIQVHRGGNAKLPPLPGTRAEALAVGTTTLLGAEATEAGLAAALTKQARWRSVHLACHGLVNVERPALSSLAITAAGEDDGFLTCLDVFRMKIPADLVVLSACETGKGKVTKAEGLVGFTRAFMFAGAPRVLCSLWKVDDEATAALMERFYELWAPKDGTPGLWTADALREAQAHVRAQPKWSHPYYWAAWVLWGLP